MASVASIMGITTEDIMSALAEEINASIHRRRGNIWTINLKGNLFRISYIEQEDLFIAPGDLQNVLETKFRRIAKELTNKYYNSI